MVLVSVTLDDKLVDIQAARALVHARGTAELCTSALDLIKATPQNSPLMDSDDKVRPIVIAISINLLDSSSELATMCSVFRSENFASSTSNFRFVNSVLSYVSLPSFNELLDAVKNSS